MPPIVIPTYRRIDNQLTWNVLHPDLRHNVNFVVRPEEADEFRSRYAPSKVHILPENRRNGYIGAMQHCFDLFGYDVWTYMDDDITSLSRRLRFFTDLTEEDKARLDESLWASERLVTAEKQDALFEAVYQQVIKPNVGAASPLLPFLPTLYRLMRTDGVSVGQQMAMFIMFNGPRVSDLRWDSIPDFALSDSLFNLRMLEKGLDCRYDCRYGFTAIPMFAGEGGITADEGDTRVARVLDAHHELHRLFPDAVKVKREGTRVPKTGYYNIPYIYQRRRFLWKSRERLNIPNEDDTRMDIDYVAYKSNLNKPKKKLQPKCTLIF